MSTPLFAIFHYKPTISINVCHDSPSIKVVTLGLTADRRIRAKVNYSLLMLTYSSTPEQDEKHNRATSRDDRSTSSPANQEGYHGAAILLSKPVRGCEATEYSHTPLSSGFSRCKAADFPDTPSTGCHQIDFIVQDRWYTKQAGSASTGQHAHCSSLQIVPCPTSAAVRLRPWRIFPLE